ncbi:MAG: ABC transporter permease [Cyclobacteriaceae bacterium]
MIRLKNSQIDYIKNDLLKKGITYEALEEDLLDHLCQAVECLLNDGYNFQEAHARALKDLGYYSDLQKDTMSSIAPLTLLRNYLKIGMRKIQQSPGISFINIGGLAVGVSVVILVVSMLRHETNFDTFHNKADRVYRINDKLVDRGDNSQFAKIPFPVGDEFKKFSEVEEVVRLFAFQGLFPDPVIQYENEVFSEELFFASDPSIGDVFDITLKSGDLKTILETPNTIVITEEIAQKYFGNANPIGKQFLFQNTLKLHVAGIINELPKTSHFHFNFLISTETFRNYWVDVGGPDIQNAWSSSLFWTYVLLQSSKSLDSFEKQLPAIINEHFPQFADTYSYVPQNLLEIHLNPQRGEIKVGTNKAQLQAISVIAAIILLACSLNFLNLTTSEFTKRVREVGIRKSFGASKSVLTGQFLIEVLLQIYFSVLMGILMAYFMSPYFNNLLGTEINPAHLWSIEMLSMYLLGGLLLGLLAGIYPSIIMSSLNVVSSLSGNSSVFRKQNVRKYSVLLQFIVSIALMMCVGIVYQQMELVKNSDLGYEQDRIVVLKSRMSIAENYEIFKGEALKNPAVHSVSQSDPIFGGWNSAMFEIEGFEEPQSVAFRYLDSDFDKVFDLKIIEGVPFDPAIHQFEDRARSAYIINKKAAEVFGWGDNSLGKRIAYNGSTRSFEGKVVGVIEDFHFESLRTEVRPLVIKYENFNNISVRIDGPNRQSALNHLQETWKVLAPEWPFEYQFLNEKILEQYEADFKFAEILTYCSMIAVAIAMLGLLGLSANIANQRLREIGIRKVLGASLNSIILLLQKEFILLAIIAFLIAVPATMFIMSGWLNDFTKRISLGVELPISILLIQFLIVIITVGYHTITSSSKKCIDILRINE